jgi:hypothetical protein
VIATAYHVDASDVVVAKFLLNNGTYRCVWRVGSKHVQISATSLMTDESPPARAAIAVQSNATTTMTSTSTSDVSASTTTSSASASTDVAVSTASTTTTIATTTATTSNVDSSTTTSTTASKSATTSAKPDAKKTKQVDRVRAQPYHCRDGDVIVFRLRSEGEDTLFKLTRAEVARGGTDRAWFSQRTGMDRDEPQVSEECTV